MCAFNKSLHFIYLKTSLFFPSYLKAIFTQYSIMSYKVFFFSFFYPFYFVLCYFWSEVRFICIIVPICNVSFLLAALKTLLYPWFSAVWLWCGFEKFVAIISSNIIFCSILTHCSPSETNYMLVSLILFNRSLRCCSFKKNIFSTLGIISTSGPLWGQFLLPVFSLDYMSYFSVLMSMIFKLCTRYWYIVGTLGFVTFLRRVPIFILGSI